MLLVLHFPVQFPEQDVPLSRAGRGFDSSSSAEELCQLLFGRRLVQTTSETIAVHDHKLPRLVPNVMVIMDCSLRAKEVGVAHNETIRLTLLLFQDLFLTLLRILGFISCFLTPSNRATDFKLASPDDFSPVLMTSLESSVTRHTRWESASQ